MDASQMGKININGALLVLDLIVEGLIDGLLDDMVEFPEGTNARRCLTKGIDHVDDARRWLRSAKRENQKRVV